MKALIIKIGDVFNIELISEDKEERQQLIDFGNNKTGTLDCEKWREIGNR